LDQPSAILYTALLLSVVAFLSIVASMGALGLQLRMKVKADLAREEARFNFEKRLAYVRTRLEKASNDWRHRAEFAEKSLLDFYEAELLLGQVRERPSPMLRTFTEYRNVKLAIDSKQEFCKQLKLSRLTARALFGAPGSAAYESLLQIIADVRDASHVLAETAYAERELTPNLRGELESIIWATDNKSPDPTGERIIQTVNQAEDLFWPALGSPVTESGP